ncbi:dienelactone hydrolase family protein [Bacillus sp. NPDC077027]|uniref:dienelactone hydrolase family protein n=1 Tax=Bacillus sp. NPDC077027 TaxID=3390548 RepID=UPI003D0847E0
MEQENKRETLFSLLGETPERNPVEAYTLKIEERESYMLETLILYVNGEEEVPAYFVKPKDTVKKRPVVLFQHSHGGNYERGKKELIEGAPYLQTPSYAKELTMKGYSVLAIDHWGFGERRGRTESEIFKEMLLTGRVMWGMMLYDSIRAIDYLYTRQDVLTERLAVLGMSMGGLLSWWTAALDERVSVCIDLCAQVDHHTLIETKNLDRHSFYYYVPCLAKHFTAADIQSLIFPRAHLSLVGTLDRLTPEIGVNRIHQALNAVYQTASSKERYQLIGLNAGHFETASMRHEVTRFLKKWL